MFDKIVKNNYTKQFFGAAITTGLVFAYTPSVIAEPIPTPKQAPAGLHIEIDTLADEDEDPASANGSFEPITLTEQILLDYADDLSISVVELKRQLFALAELTQHIESDNNRYATNAYSGAMSYYQFLPDSVVTAVNRLEILMKRAGLGRVPAWASAVHKDPQAIYSLSNPQQRLLMLVNILEQESSRDLILQLTSGNNQAAKTLYYTYHHTAPDPATKSRTEDLFFDYFPKTF